MKLAKSALCTLALTIVSCGVQQKSNEVSKKTEEAPATESNTVEETAARPAAAPAMMIVKVKEDANGEVLDGAANVEFRATNGNVASLNQNNIANTFESAEAANINNDNLDGDSSDGQWGWRRGYRNGYRNFGYRGYRNFGYRGFGFGYRPYYRFGGYNYGYNYYNTYRWGGSRYYCYY